MLEEFKWAWQFTSAPARWTIYAIAAVLVLWLASATWSAIDSGMRARSYARAQTEAATERERLERQATEANARADMLEAAAREKQHRIATLEEAIRQSGVRAQAIAADLEKARAEYETEISALGGAVDPDELLARLRARRAAARR